MRTSRECNYAVAVILAVAGCAPAHAAPAQNAPHTNAGSSPLATSAEPFADEIANFLAADRVAPPPAHGVLFVGSSTIRMWPALSADFPGVPVIQRGFGGSELSDVVHYAPRIVIPYKPRLIIVYAGDNDIAAGKTAKAVFGEYVEFVRLVERALPDTRIAFVSIKPSIARWPLIEQIRAANSMVRDFAARDPRLLYVDTYTPMLGADGRPRRELFIEDGLHMNDSGYALWRSILNPIVRASRTQASNLIFRSETQ
jgi:lysophospholipase L1-like esterase